MADSPPWAELLIELRRIADALERKPRRVKRAPPARKATAAELDQVQRFVEARAKRLGLKR